MPDLKWAEERPLRRAAVIFDTRYGQTQKVAEAIARGIRAQQVSADVLKAEDVDLKSLTGYDLLAVGSPTERLTVSPAIRQLLGRMKGLGLAGRYGFAFETRAPHHVGVAGRHIESTLEQLGLRMRLPFRSATVIEPKGAPRPRSPSSETEGHPLDPAEEQELETIGTELVQVIRGESLEQWAR
ncbi:MAG: flavodoxin domain-containing protein [Candidatus Lutacidiplasmatales archaeon]